jgi:transposase
MTGDGLLFVGDDWSEDRHDIEVMNPDGKKLATAGLPEGADGMARFHALIARHLPDGTSASEVAVGIETDRGPWVAALVTAGYRVFAVNPLQARAYRNRLSVSGAKSDKADAHTLADMVGVDWRQLRPTAADTPEAEAVKVIARAHKTLIWDRTRHTQRMRYLLRDYFPAALAAFDDLDAPEALELLAKAPTPATAAKLTHAQVSAALKRAGRRGDLHERATTTRAALRAQHLSQPAAVTAAASTALIALTKVITTLNEQIKTLQGQVEQFFGQHPDAEIILSQPGLGPILGAGCSPSSETTTPATPPPNIARTTPAPAPLTQQSGTGKSVSARFVHNDRLIDALLTQAATAIRFSPGARALYTRQRTRGVRYNAALRTVANRLVGILHGCLKTRTLYNEATAWP